jgi:alkylhydroperoxidase family enzyme
MERIRPLQPPYSEAIGAEFSRLMPAGVEPLRLFRVLAHNPRVLGKIRASNLLDRGSLDRRHRELVILRTCARCDSQYEWGVHVTAFARRYGIEAATIEATVTADAEDPVWTDDERTLVALVDALHDFGVVSDSLWERLRERFANDQIIELIVLVGFYHTISFVTQALELSLEEGAARFPDRVSST